MPTRYAESSTARVIMVALRRVFVDGATVRQLQEEIGGHEQSIRQNLKVLVAEGLIEVRKADSGRRGFSPSIYSLRS